jgi:hypothetical protein
MGREMMKIKTKIKILLWLKEHKINFKNLKYEVVEFKPLEYVAATFALLLCCMAYPLFIVIYSPKLLCNLAYKILNKKWWVGLSVRHRKMILYFLRNK